MSKMYMVIGAPGCGKSTYIQNHLKENEIVLDYKCYNEMFGTNYNDSNLSLFVPHNATYKYYHYS